MIGIENREHRDCESLIRVNTSQYFWLGNSSISTQQMSHLLLINHFIEDYYCHQSCFFFHLHLTVTDVIIIYTVAVWGIFLYDREVRGQGERRNSPGFKKDSASFPRTLPSCSTDAFRHLDCPSRDPTTSLPCTVSQLWLYQRGRLQYVHTCCITFPAGPHWGCGLPQTLKKSWKRVSFPCSMQSNYCSSSAVWQKQVWWQSEHLVKLLTWQWRLPVKL